MTDNYFAIERNNKFIDSVVLRDENGVIMFEDIMGMSYNEIEIDSEYIQQFVVSVMDSTNTYFEEDDDYTAITLIGPDGIFIWGIFIGPDDDNGLEYQFIDWQKDGKAFKYEDNEISLESDLTN